MVILVAALVETVLVAEVEVSAAAVVVMVFLARVAVVMLAVVLLTTVAALRGRVPSWPGLADC